MVRSREELVAALRSASAGTRIQVAPGVYAGGLHAANLAGNPDEPIVLEAADPANPPAIRGGKGGIMLSGCSFIELRDLVLEGATENGINVDDGGRGGDPARGIVLRRITVRNSSPKGNRDGIKISGIEGFQIVDCTVEDWGAAGSAIDLVGCHNGIVEKSTFRRTGAAAVENREANGVQAKGGSSGIVIRGCRFLNTGGRGVNLGGHTGRPFFRPRDAKWEARDLAVEDCTFQGSQAPVVFAGVDGAVVRRNEIRYPGRWVFRILQENTADGMAPCRNGVIADNRIVFRSGRMAAAVNVGPDTRPETFRFENNSWLCEDTPPTTRRLVSLPVPETGGIYPADGEAAE